jgi:DNA-binding NarL/FixJ family response regulator
VDEPISVVLVEDNEVFREALELLLGMRSDIRVVGSVGDGAEAVEAVVAHRPQVVLMDYRLPGIDGATATRAVLDACPGTAVICLTAEATDEEDEAVREAGAAGLVRKGGPIDELVAAIRDATVRAA